MHGVPNILGNFAWGTEYPRKFSIQDAVFPALEGGSKFPWRGTIFPRKNCTGMPYFLGCQIACDKGIVQRVASQKLATCINIHTLIEAKAAYYNSCCALWLLPEGRKIPVQSCRSAFRLARVFHFVEILYLYVHPPFLGIFVTLMEILRCNRRKSGPAKTSPAGPALTPKAPFTRTNPGYFNPD